MFITFKGQSMCLTVAQFPSNILLQPGELMNITCSHHDKNYDKLYWYQQINQQDLKLVGFLNFKQPNEEQKGFKLSGDAEKEGFLTAVSVTVDYSAFYFCAVSKPQ